VHVLATSREALRIEGEHVYRLEALPCPPDAPGLSAAAIQQFPAAQLFVERALAGGARLEINDTEAAIVSDICRKLDGVALAIELAARRVESHGLEQTAGLLDQHLTLLWRGSRTAPPRQKTLQATMDWSYELLSELERSVLRRLAVFVGLFTLEAALEVIPSSSLDRAAVFEAIDTLVEKSMVAARPVGAMMRYRLLDTTRAYALELGVDQDERTDLSRRHAAYYRRWLEQTGSEWSSLSTGAERAPHFGAVNNVRAALEWCFSEGGDVRIGIGLAAAAAPVFRAMALFPECHRWSERALAAFDEKTRGGPDEMQLQASLGLSLMLMRGHDEVAIAALNRSLEIARSTGDHLNEVRLLGTLHFYHLRGGEFRACLRYAERAKDIAGIVEDPAVTALAQTLMGVTLNFMGDLVEARIQLEAAIEAGKVSASNRKTHFGFDNYSWAGNALIRNLWLQGYPEQAKAAIERVFDEAVRTKHPMALAMVVNSISVLLWDGDLDAVEEHLEWFVTRAEADDFGPYLHLGQAFRAELAIRRGDVEAGIQVLQSRLEKLHAIGYQLLTVRFNVELVSGFASTGRYDDALKLADETAQLIEIQGYLSYLPELLRVKGRVLLMMPDRRLDGAEACFAQALELSRAQKALAWQLRTATDLASLWVRRGRSSEAHGLLWPIFEQFTEGGNTADVGAARLLLSGLD
jgi:predicted ATPase